MHNFIIQWDDLQQNSSLQYYHPLCIYSFKCAFQFLKWVVYNILLCSMATIVQKVFAPFTETLQSPLKFMSLICVFDGMSKIILLNEN